MSRIEGTGIKTPSSGSQKMAKVYYGGLEAEKRRRLSEEVKQMMKDFGSSPASDPMPKGRGMGDRFDPTAAKPNFFSPGGGAFDSRNDVQVASADGVQSLSLPGSDEFNREVEQYEKSIRYDHPVPGQIDKFGTDETGNLTTEGKKNLEESYKIYRDFNYERNPIKYVPGIDFSKKEEKPSFLQRASNLAGSIFNAATGTQTAAAGEMPSGTQFSPSGDTSFASYRMAGGTQQQQGSGIVTPFSQTSMGKGEPRSITKFKDTSMGRKPVANLPSDYKQTEAREFAKAAAFQQAKKNPNVKAGVDSKGQPTATAVQKSRTEAGSSARTAEGNKARVQQNARAKAQAAAINRKISGKSISQTKAANRAAMRASAAARNASFQARKKAGKLSKSERTAKGQRAAKKAAAKKRAQAAAKARNARRKRSRRSRGRRGRSR